MTEPQSLSLIDQIWHFLWVLFEPVWAVTTGFNPYIVLIAAAILGLMPGRRRDAAFKVLIATLFAFALQFLYPLWFGLNPLIPDLGMSETYVLLAMLALEATAVIAGLHLLLSHVKPRTPMKRVRKTRSLDFKPQNAAPIAVSLSRTLGPADR